jgi:uncharacterized protein
MRVRMLLAVLALAVVSHQSLSARAAPKADHKPPSILLVGASGMIGSRILTEATSRGHYVIAASRHPEKIATGQNIKAIQLDATDEKAFAAEARHVDVIVLATSPRGGGDPLKEAKSLSDSAIATARATHKRLVVVGGAGSLNYPDGRRVVDTLPAAYQGEALAMRNFLDALKASDVDWTFVCPAFSIAPGTRTGKYRVGTNILLSNAKGESRISAEDYADALVSELEKPAHGHAQMTVAY